MIIKLGAEGRIASYNNALTLRHGGRGQEVRVPWVAGSICYGVEAGQPHPFTGSGAPPGGQGSGVRFSGDVSANPLAVIGCISCLF
jgi:hypothetical protein